MCAKLSLHVSLARLEDSGQQCVWFRETSAMSDLTRLPRYDGRQDWKGLRHAWMAEEERGKMEGWQTPDVAVGDA